MSRIGTDVAVDIDVDVSRIRKLAEHAGQINTQFAITAKKVLPGWNKQWQTQIRKFTPHDTGQLLGSLNSTVRFTGGPRGTRIRMEHGFGAKHATKLEKGHGPGQAGSWSSNKFKLARWARRHLQKKGKKGKKAVRGAMTSAYFIWRKHQKEGFKVPLAGPGKNKGKGMMLEQASDKQMPKLRSQVNRLLKKVILRWEKAYDGG